VKVSGSVVVSDPTSGITTALGSDGAELLDPVDGGVDADLVVTDVEAAESVEVAQVLGRDRVGDVNLALAAQHGLLVHALGVDLARRVHQDLHGLGVAHRDVVIDRLGGEGAGRDEAGSCQRDAGEADEGGAASVGGAHASTPVLCRVGPSWSWS
jgi:hypothetical protein